MPKKPPTHGQLISRRRPPSERNPVVEKVHNSVQWKKLRAVYRAKHPLCADPFGIHARFGRVEVAAAVHHKIPIAQRPDLAYKWENLMSVCASCHAKLERDAAAEEKQGD